jgi:hypothetical protein
VLPLIVGSQAADKAGFVLVGKGRIAAFEVASHPIPERTGTAIQDMERGFAMAAGAAVRSGTYVEQPLVFHSDRAYRPRS